MSIVRVGLAETNKFAEGYDAIFGTNKKRSESGSKPKKPAKKAEAKAKSAKKKKK